MWSRSRRSRHAFDLAVKTVLSFSSNSQSVSTTNPANSASRSVALAGFVNASTRSSNATSRRQSHALTGTPSSSRTGAATIFMAETSGATAQRTCEAASHGSSRAAGYPTPTRGQRLKRVATACLRCSDICNFQFAISNFQFAICNLHFSILRHAYGPPVRSLPSTV